MRIAPWLVGVGLVITGGCFEETMPAMDGTTTGGSSGASTVATPCDQGSLGCACFPNGTCNATLVCVGGLCEPFDGSTTTSTTGVDSSTGTTSESTTTTSADTGSSSTGSESSTGFGAAHILFTSSTSLTGVELGGLEGADMLCTQLGQRLVAGPWLAVLSTTTVSASARIDVDGDVINTAGELLASTEAELFSGRLQATPAYDEGGVEVPGSDLAWTGSVTDDCLGWTIDEPTVFGTVGLPTSTDMWLDTTVPLPCSASPRIYCISQ